MQATKWLSSFFFVFNSDCEHWKHCYTGLMNYAQPHLYQYIKVLKQKSMIELFVREKASSAHSQIWFWAISIKKLNHIQILKMEHYYFIQSWKVYGLCNSIWNKLRNQWNHKSINEPWNHSKIQENVTNLVQFWIMHEMRN